MQPLLPSSIQVLAINIRKVVQKQWLEDGIVFKPLLRWPQVT